MEHPLTQWLRATSTTQAAFAAALGLTQGAVSRLCNGGTPTMATAARIQSVTGGAVPVSVWATVAIERERFVSDAAPEVTS